MRILNKFEMQLILKIFSGNPQHVNSIIKVFVMSFCKISTLLKYVKMSVMDFKLVLEKLLTAFKEQDIRYALMGGMALGAWGVPRGTVDIDFLVHRDDIGKAASIMQGLGYECHHKTENVSQYLSPLKIFGEVDFLHAFRTHSLSMLQRTEEKQMFNGTVTVKILQLEDLIGFKLQGMVSDDSRKSLDLSDIESLMAVNKKNVDWTLVKEYFDLFNCIELFHKLREKYGDA